MFVYSGQIVDEAERQRFVQEMGRAVLDTFLRQDSPLADAGSSNVLDAIRRS
jgi:hypothetical protein